MSRRKVQTTPNRGLRPQKDMTRTEPGPGRTGGPHPTPGVHPEKAKPESRNTLLCVANFPSDAGYAWWLMERFWALLAQEAVGRGGRAVVAFPKILKVSDALRSAPLVLEEKDISTGLRGLDGDTLRFIRRNRVRTVYLTDRHYWSPAYALFRACGVKSIILHDHVPGERQAPGHLRLLIKRSRYRMKPAAANLYLGVSKFVRERFTQIGGVPSELCTYVHNGVPPTPSTGLKDVREVFGLPRGAQVVVSVGRAHPYKGIDFIMECAEALIRGEKRTEVVFLHLGGGPELERLRGMVRDRRLSDHFLLPGQRTDVALLLPSCQVAFHASQGEAFSLSILEFMAAGLPAIVPNHCGNPEAISHGETGYLYPLGDRRAAVQHLRELLDHPERAMTLGAAACRRVEEHFSLDRMDRAFMAAVDGAIHL